MMRLQGWERRLAELIEAARARPYVLGEHDCFRLMCANVEAMTGVDRWPEFKGYRTKREALALTARHGKTFEDAFDWFFGDPRVGVKFARRGDALAIRTDDGEKHLAVCNGHDGAFLGERGLLFVPRSICLCAWRIG